MLGRGQQTTSGVRPPVFSLTTAVPSRQRSQMASPSVRLCLVFIQVNFPRSSQLSGGSWINDHISFIAKYLFEGHVPKGKQDLLPLYFQPGVPQAN